MKMNKTITRVKRTIAENELIPSGSSVLIALSGGADSVFLTHVLKEMSAELDLAIYACHVEHGIRGADSVRDMEFSRELCRSLGIEFFGKSFDVPGEAARLKISEEAAGRKIRYEYFSEIMAEHGIDLLATAHHRDDRVETIVMNMLRGSGLRGFVGIEYKNGSVIRPLLDITKDEILEFCRSEKIDYCTDDTNFNTEYTRNKIRHELIPVLRKYNPSFDECIIRESCIMSEEDKFIECAAASEYELLKSDRGLNLEKLAGLDTAIRRRVIYMYIADAKGTRRDISFEDVNAVLKLCISGESGKCADIGGGLRAQISYGRLYIGQEAGCGDFEYRLLPGTPCDVKELGIRFTLAQCRAPDDNAIKINPFDTVILRNRRPGDVFYPTGMEGRKKIKDYFIDKKIGRAQRTRIPILVVNGEIAAVVGMRADRRFADKNGGFKLLTEN
ncbi:MAG: tRNA lysidine(34) synthetase TilS [Clostridia bacterium]|nr:tRNA lysidine(34) synthetase TilS [Clostridia bacterium]